MRSILWLGPDGERYSVFLGRKSDEAERQNVVFWRPSDGWTSCASIEEWRTLSDLTGCELMGLLRIAVEAATTSDRSGDAKPVVRDEAATII